MQIRSSVDRYGAVVIIAHWTTAAFILFQIISGFRAVIIHEATGKIALLRMHVVLGIAILALTVFRLAWRWFVDRAPIATSGTPPLPSRAAAVVHSVMYFVLLAIAVSGIGVLIVSGAGSILFGGRAAPLPEFTLYRPFAAHAVAAWLMVVLVAGHVTAALYHQFVKRDRLLARMGIGRSPKNLGSGAAPRDGKPMDGKQRVTAI